MKLAFFIRNLAGVVGGAERGVLALARAMAERGHDVSVVTHDRSGGAPHYPVSPKIALVRLGAPADPSADNSASGPAKTPAAASPKSKKKKKPRPIRRFLKTLEVENPVIRRAIWRFKNGAVTRDIGRWLDAAAPDVAIAFLPTITPQLTAALRSRAIPSVLAFRNTPEFVLHAREGDIDGALRAQHMRDTLDRYAAITVQAPQYVELLPPEARDRAVCIPNEIDGADYAATRSVPLLTRDKSVLCVGRLEPQKRPMLLLEAFAQIADAAPDWRLVFYGEGGEKAALRAFVDAHDLGERVSFRGVISDMPAAYVSGQIICAPSRYEGFPRALSEGMSSGLAPIGCDDCLGVAHLLTDGSGLLAEVRGAPDAAQADILGRELLALTTDPERRAALGALARNRADNFAPEPVFDQWEALFDRVAKRRP